MFGAALSVRFAVFLIIGQAAPAEVTDRSASHVSARIIEEALHYGESDPPGRLIVSVWLPTMHPALRYRVLTPSEAMQMEIALHVLRDRPLEHFFEPGTDCRAYSVANIQFWLHKWPHAAAIAECVRALEAQLSRLERYPDHGPPGWAYFWSNVVTNLPSERRLYAAVHYWERSSHRCLRKAAEWYRRELDAAWSGMRLPERAIRSGVLVWPLPPLLRGYKCILGPGELAGEPYARLVPMKRFVKEPYRPAVPHLAPGEPDSAALIVAMAEQRCLFYVSRSGLKDWQEPIRDALRAIVASDTYPVHLRLRALDVLVRRIADYDTAFLRRLALDPDQDFATEVMSVAAVCALSRCPSKEALQVLCELIELGPEWVTFQAASHLRYVAGLNVPPLVAQSRKDDGRSDAGNWTDIPRWFLYRHDRYRVAQQLREQIGQLPEDWPWHDIASLRPYLLHEHLNPRETERREIPEVVVERSAGEDFFWKPFGGDAPAAPRASDGAEER